MLLIIRLDSCSIPPDMMYFLQTQKKAAQMAVLRLDENQIEQIDGMTTEYPYCMHRRDLTDIVIPWHWHEELELGYLDTGTSVISTLNAEYTVHQGDGFFINTNVLCSKRNAAAGCPALEINHLFHPVFLSGHFRSRFETKYLQPILKNRQIEVRVIRRSTPMEYRKTRCSAAPCNSSSVVL